MNLNEIIYRRKSVRSYTDALVDDPTLKKIKEFAVKLTPLYPDIKVRSEIVSRDSIKCILPWIPPQLIAIYSEEREGAAENVGFLFQQMDLYLQTLGLGACWLGMGKMNPQFTLEDGSDGMKFMILLAFGHPKEDALRSDLTEFRRRSLSDISDRIDERLEPARLAPSSVNSQPWYFVHEGEVIHAYCSKQCFWKAIALGEMNRIDMGICLAHLFVANPDTFRFFCADQAANIKGHTYTGSFCLG